MQFAPYIKQCYSHTICYSSIQLTLLFILMLLMSACTLTPDTQESKNESGNLESISKEFTDLVTLPKNKQAQPTPSERDIKFQVLNTKNNYLEQEKRLMSGVPNNIIETYQQALTLMDQQKWLAASELFDQVISKQPNLSGSYVNKALILTELSKQQGAKKIEKTEQAKQETTIELLLDKAISVNSLNPYAQYFKGTMLQEKGLFKQASQHYARALSIWPNYGQAQLSMAILLELYRGQLREAYSYYSAYLLHKPNDKQVLRWQAALALKIKRAGLDLPAQQGN